MIFSSNLYKRFFHITVNLSKMIFIVGIVLKFIVVNSDFNSYSFNIDLVFYPGGILLAACYLLSIFHPIKESPNWFLIFPELNEGLKKK